MCDTGMALGPNEVSYILPISITTLSKLYCFIPKIRDTASARFAAGSVTSKILGYLRIIIS